MAVSIDTQIAEYFTWGSYPYETWGGDEFKTWGSSGVVEWLFTDKEGVNLLEGIPIKVSFEEIENTFDGASGSFDVYDTVIEKHIQKNRFETMSLNESFDRNLVAARTFVEPLDICETYWDVIQFNLNFSESFNVADDETNTINKRTLYKLKLTDSKSVANSILRKENVNVAELLDNYVVFKRDFNENVNATELPFKHSSLPFDESFSLEDTSYRDNIKTALEKLQIADTYKRNTKTIRCFNDDINLKELGNRDYACNAYEAFKIKDIYLKNLDGVYSNIFVSEGEFSDEDFKRAINIAPGYTEFIDFKVGEYDYQEALVRVRLGSGSQAQPTAQGIVMHVDIPDTDDRGAVIISDTSAPTEIRFNKHYYTVPEVQVTLRSGNTASGFITPNITEITTNYFKVELLTAGGERTTGTISWVAKGY